MNKLQIIFLATAGALSFAGTFGATWWLKNSKPAITIPTPERSPVPGKLSDSSTEQELPDVKIAEQPGLDPARGMTEKQMQGLIYDIREKMKEYKFKERQLTEQEERIRVTREGLKEDIDRLNQLQTQLTTVFANLKKQEEALSKRQLEIAADEKVSMTKLAQTYDKMDAVQASKVFVNMVTNQQLTDAVKILYYMSDRTCGKVLGEIAGTKPDAATRLSLELKRVKEKE